MKEKAHLAIIGGTGLYSIEGLEVLERVWPDTPWGKPSDEIVIARYSEGSHSFNVAFLPRHGKGHFLLPTEIPQKANMAALKMLGVEYIVAFSSVGSLKEEIAPGHFVLPDQIIDRTRLRNGQETFFGEGIVAHMSFGEPFCRGLSELLAFHLEKINIPSHVDETIICMEGPAFSTRAESKLYKSWGAGIINMSVLPEAKLARELEISYQMVCMSTDYDSWRESEEPVTTEEIMRTLEENSKKAAALIKSVLPDFLKKSPLASPLKGSVKSAVMTAEAKRPAASRDKLNLLLPGTF